ncbi:RES family NAD+ phosphorylase [Pedobacter sp. SD-b]|uniref:RES family NAD+ phosphorylase n=1 Tax=Pedobacter segetis TaxID=2793069 RepID=A0ABS1BJA8_9SPHI|nr:RES family NAD+ phosphorylase [Pedobacter segetis]MBK0382964.1 RES family NAD+ phosphorylase [Pedobacter segetis]
MELYRLGSCQYVNNLSGEGSRIYGGRWNSVGIAAVYFTTSKALAVLECLVHLPPRLLPYNFCMAKFECNLPFLKIDETTLPTDWNSFPFLVDVQIVGDKFLKYNQLALLRVPSAIVKGEFNFILNPLKIKADDVMSVETEAFSFDERLV